MKKEIHIPDSTITLVKIYIRMFNSCENDEQRAIAIHAIYELGFDETAEAMVGFITGRSVNFQSLFDATPINWQYVQTGRAAIKTRQNKWTFRGLFRIGQRWQSTIQEVWRFCKAAHHGHYISIR